MSRALADGHVGPTDVAYVNAHGSSTPLNDPTETLALKQVFGDHARSLQVSSTKGYYGHALGASGAFEAAICALALERRWLPPTVNLDCPADDCDLDYIPHSGLEESTRHSCFVALIDSSWEPKREHLLRPTPSNRLRPSGSRTISPAAEP
jgi:3-oxoacyl-[acyl-carrier-protein] synthase II